MRVCENHSCKLAAVPVLTSCLRRSCNEAWTCLPTYTLRVRLLFCNNLHNLQARHAETQRLLVAANAELQQLRNQFNTLVLEEKKQLGTKSRAAHRVQQLQVCQGVCGACMCVCLRLVCAEPSCVV